MQTFDMTPVGLIHTPFTEPAGMPIQPAGASGIRGTVEVRREYRAGLQDLDGFSHLLLLYVFHRSAGYALQVTPYLDTKPHGVFATRAPRRPNPIGLSVVRLDRIEDGILHVGNVDMLDGSPLLDIKPYVPQFDGPAQVRTGWLEQAGDAVDTHKSDDRFA